MSAIQRLGDKLSALSRRRRADYQALFSSPLGQRVLADLARRARAGQGSVVIGDTHMTYFQEGRRDMVLHIQSQLNMSDEDLVRVAQTRSTEDGY